ncbi:hypothetical protein F1880_008622 [Penicillium rolfsii]|nr:hypothetical protein F1880_008622 [Penicillium rolfsii]
MAPSGKFLLNVNLYDPISKTSEVTNVVSIGADSLDGQLKTIRETLYKEGALESNKQLKLQRVSYSDPAENYSGPAENERGGLTEPDQVSQFWCNADVTRQSKPELLKTTVKELASSYSHADYRADAGSGKAKNPANMTQEDWTTVLHHTNYLSGHRLVFAKDSAGRSKFQRMERAPYQGFQLKSRSYEPLDIARNQNVNALVSDSDNRFCSPDFNFPSTHAMQYSVEIPLFVVDDESYVDVFETASDVSNSMARSSFSKTNIEASAGGGAFGYSGGVSAGFSRSESNAMSTSTKSSGKTINITYNLIDEIEQVRKKQTEAALLRLHHKFGHFFATRVELGGRLYSSEDLKAFGEASEEEAASAMKASASASFSGPSAQASASFSKEGQQASSSASSISHLQRSISWQAQGGDTLLCNNPPKWCATVAPFENWRVIKQDDVVPLGQLIGQFEKYRDIPELFTKIAGLSQKVETVSFRLIVDNENQKGQYLAVAMEGGKIGEGIKSEISQKLNLGPYFSISEQGPEYDDVKHRTQDFKTGAHLTEENDYSIFEVEVYTFMGQPANIHYGTVLRLKNPKTGRYLSASTEIPQLPGRLFLFPGEQDHDATDFIFGNPADPNSHAPIQNDDIVDIRIFNRVGQLKGFAALCAENTIASKTWEGNDKNDVLFFKFQIHKELNVVKGTESKHSS